MAAAGWLGTIGSAEKTAEPWWTASGEGPSTPNEIARELDCMTGPFRDDPYR